MRRCFTACASASSFLHPHTALVGQSTRTHTTPSKDRQNSRSTFWGLPIAPVDTSRRGVLPKTKHGRRGSPRRRRTIVPNDMKETFVVQDAPQASPLYGVAAAVGSVPETVTGSAPTTGSSDDQHSIVTLSTSHADVGVRAMTDASVLLAAVDMLSPLQLVDVVDGVVCSEGFRASGVFSLRHHLQQRFGVADDESGPLGAPLFAQQLADHLAETSPSLSADQLALLLRALHNLGVRNERLMSRVFELLLTDRDDHARSILERRADGQLDAVSANTLLQQAGAEKVDADVTIPANNVAIQSDAIQPSYTIKEATPSALALLFKTLVDTSFLFTPGLLPRLVDKGVVLVNFMDLPSVATTALAVSKQFEVRSSDSVDLLIDQLEDAIDEFATTLPEAAPESIASRPGTRAVAQLIAAFASIGVRHQSTVDSLAKLVAGCVFTTGELLDVLRVLHKMHYRVTDVLNPQTGVPQFPDDLTVAIGNCVCAALEFYDDSAVVEIRRLCEKDVVLAEKCPQLWEVVRTARVRHNRPGKGRGSEPKDNLVSEALQNPRTGKKWKPLGPISAGEWKQRLKFWVQPSSGRGPTQ